MRRTLMLILAPLLLLACDKKDDGATPEPVPTPAEKVWTKKTVAVILPGDATTELGVKLRDVARWFTESFSAAQEQSGDTTRIDLQLEWYDENSGDLALLGVRLSQRSDVDMVIGPLTNDHVAIVAKTCQSGHKPVIVPAATAEVLVRQYAVSTSGESDANRKPFLWSLTETDVTLFKALLLKGQSSTTRLSHQFSIFSPQSLDGETFSEWATYLALDGGLDANINVRYSNETDLYKQFQEYLKHPTSDAFLVCATQESEQMIRLAELRQEHVTDDAPFVPPLVIGDKALYTTIATQRSGKERLKAVDGLVGVSPYADPTSGFVEAYYQKFGTEPLPLECLFYDALLLSGVTIWQTARTVPDYKSSDLNNTIVKMTCEDRTMSPAKAGWDTEGMTAMLTEAGLKSYGLRGTTGSINFDRDLYTTRAQNFYVGWSVINGEFRLDNYLTENGTNGTVSITEAWRAEGSSQIEQFFTNKEGNIGDYQELRAHQAVLVQGSEGWDNYRHQADVLSMYQMLKQNGYTDDQIILITAEDLANHPSNKQPGYISTTENGPNLSEGVVRDYCTDTLTVKDVIDIIGGDANERLKTVVKGDLHTNVLVFWSGHGYNNSSKDRGLEWRTSGKLSDKEIGTLSNSLGFKSRFRKLLWVVEGCHAGAAMQKLEDIMGTMAICAAAAGESSFSDNYSSLLGVWRCNRFTKNLQAAVRKDPSITYFELYTYLMNHTLGSHVVYVNESDFDKMLSASPHEFLFP